MELILAVIIAGPLGYFVSARRRALGIYLALWAVTFPIQTAVVFHESGSDDNALYWIFNAVILALGIGLNRLVARVAERRRGKLDTVSPA